MKTLFSTIFILASFLSFSQNSFQITDTTKKWNTVTYGAWSWNVMHCGGTRTNKFQGEVIFNGTPFFLVFEAQDSLQQGWDMIGGVSEDTVSQKVYFSEWDPERIGLIYDFGLLVGESVIIDNYYAGFLDVLLICDSIDYLNIDGAMKKRIYLHSPGFAGSDIWIEGIGSKFGLLFSGFNGSGMAGGGSDLLCCSKNDTVIFMNPTYNSCYIDEFYPKIASALYDTAYLNTFYEFQVQISDTNNIESFALIGEVIPDGFQFDGATGLLTGMPNAIGSFPCIITIKNNDLGFLTDILDAEINVALPTTVQDQPKQFGIKIHPNPFKTSFLISSDVKRQEFYYLEIFNSAGEIIDTRTIAETACKIDGSNYKKGVYLLKFTDVNQNLLRLEKVIKE